MQVSLYGHFILSQIKGTPNERLARFGENSLLECRNGGVLLERRKRAPRWNGVNFWEEWAGPKVFLDDAWSRRSWVSLDYWRIRRTKFKLMGSDENTTNMPCPPRVKYLPHFITNGGQLHLCFIFVSISTTPLISADVLWTAIVRGHISVPSSNSNCHANIISLSSRCTQCISATVELKVCWNRVYLHIRM